MKAVRVYILSLPLSPLLSLHSSSAVKTVRVVTRLHVQCLAHARTQTHKHTVILRGTRSWLAWRANQSSFSLTRVVTKCG